MSVLDSRSLTYLDCFWQRFGAPGAVSFAVTGPLAELVRPDNPPFSITVVARQDLATSAQHDVFVRHDNGQFVLDTPAAEVAAGDVLMWHSDDGAPPYSVWGASGDGQFSSASLRGGAVFSHAFGSPGEYDWADANGSGLSGRILVRNPEGSDRTAAQEWNRILREGSLVIIDGDQANPQEITIVTGQTVFFAVENAPGITITDASLLASR